jgi:hypothetical protein
MPEPLARSEPSEGPLAEAAGRLERALARLEDLLNRTPAAIAPAPDEEAVGRISELQAANDQLSAELGTTKKRSRKLKAAAAEASEAIGRAAAEVRRALDDDAAAQGLFAFALESEEGSGDEPSTDGQPEPEEETTA